MFKAMEQLENGEFTGFILEAENEKEIISQISNSYSDKTEWYVINETTKEEEKILEKI